MFAAGSNNRNLIYTDPSTGALVKPFTEPGDAWSQGLGVGRRGEQSAFRLTRLSIALRQRAVRRRICRAVITFAIIQSRLRAGTRPAREWFRCGFLSRRSSLRARGSSWSAFTGVSGSLCAIERVGLLDSVRLGIEFLWNPDAYRRACAVAGRGGLPGMPVYYASAQRDEYRVSCIGSRSGVRGVLHVASDSWRHRTVVRYCEC